MNLKLLHLQGAKNAERAERRRQWREEKGIEDPFDILEREKEQQRQAEARRRAEEAAEAEKIEQAQQERLPGLEQGLEKNDSGSFRQGQLDALLENLR